MSDATPSIASPVYWESAAAGWALHAELFRSYTAPVSQWLVDAVAPTAGERLLELAAGMGETGFMAAPALLPGGTLICTDRGAPAPSRRTHHKRTGSGDVPLPSIVRSVLLRP